VPGDRARAVREERRRLVTAQGVGGDGDAARVALPDADCDELRDVVVAEQAQVVIEIGLAYGNSALAIGEALVGRSTRAGRHLIIDPFQDRFEHAGWDAVRAAGLTDVAELVAERSQLALPRLVTEGLVADAAFVDGSHIFHNVFVDLFFLRELVRPGGVVILDDCQWPSVATAVRYFERNTGWRPVPVSERTRLRVWRLPAVRAEPTFESFTPFGS
jgi:predicted O-methyltransferase YrrM